MTPVRGIRRAAYVVGAALLAYLPACGASAPRAEGAPVRPLIVFMSDFGTVDEAVAICKGVMLGIAPAAEIIDLSHQVTPYSIADGARLLARTAPYYRAGTVFVSVIDPGVGTARRSVVVKTKRGQFFVLPDNGLITLIVDRDGVADAREITNPRWLLEGSSSSTFHGRDVYSPVAAHLARGDDLSAVGPSIGALTRIELPRAVMAPSGISGTVVGLDGPYGNLVTNIGAEEFGQLGYRLGERVRVKLDRTDLTVPLVSTFADVPAGEPLLFVDSRGLLSLAINQGNFAQVHGVVIPAPLLIYRK